MTAPRTGRAIALIVGGLIANNFAFVHDLVVRDAHVIWMGPKTWTLAAGGIVAVLAGLWLLTRPSPPGAPADEAD